MQKGTMILEGGAVRGVFTAGVLDVLMEKDYYLGHVIGVSAGSCNAVDYISKQPGRTRDCIIRVGKDDGSLISFRSLIRNRSLFDMDLLFEEDPHYRHPFDFDTFFRSPITCEIVATNCLTGKAKYFSVKASDDGGDAKRARLMRICRASCSLPLMSPMVEIDGVPYLDGGLADSVPIVHALKSGSRKNVIVLTRNRGYRKSISRKTAAFYQTTLRGYPELAKAICLRPVRYNRVVSAIEKWEDEGKVFVIRPLEKTVSRTERDPERLMEFYRHGRERMEAQFDDLKAWMED